MHRQFFRMLLDPAADAGGGTAGTNPGLPAGGQVPPAPAPVQNPPAPAPPTPVQNPPAPGTSTSALTLTGPALEQWQRDQADLARLRQAEQHQQDQQRAAEIATAQQRGNWEQVARLREAENQAAMQRATAAETRAQNYALSSSLATALSGYQLVDPAWGPILTDRWAKEFSVFPLGDTYQVRHRDGRTPEQFLADEFKKPMYAGVLAAAVAGGPQIGDVSQRGAFGPQFAQTPAGREMQDWTMEQRRRAADGVGTFGLRAIG